MPSILETLIVELKGDDKELQRALIRALRGAERSAGGIERRFERLGRSFTKVGTRLSVGVTTPLVALGVAAVRSASQVEVLETSFTTLLGSGEKAQGFLEDLQQFAASTPFRFPELARSAQSLVAFGIAADETIPTLQRIGDVSAGVGSSVSDIAEIYGKARVQGRLFAEDINQLTGRGIPIIGELAAQFGVTESEVRELVSTGQVGFGNLEQAFISLTSEGGKFFGLTQAQAETTAGKLSTLQDNIGLLGAEFGEVLLPAINSIVTGLTTLVQNVNSMDDGTRRLVIGAAAAAAALGPMAIAFGSLLTSIPGLVKGFALLQVGFGRVIARGPLVASILRSIGAAVFSIPGLIVAAGVALGAFVVDSLRAIRRLENATRDAINVTGQTAEITALRTELVAVQAEITKQEQLLRASGAPIADIDRAFRGLRDRAAEIQAEIAALLEALEATPDEVPIDVVFEAPDVEGFLGDLQDDIDENPLTLPWDTTIPDVVLTETREQLEKLAADAAAILADTEEAVGKSDRSGSRFAFPSRGDPSTGTGRSFRPDGSGRSDVVGIPNPLTIPGAGADVALSGLPSLQAIQAALEAPLAVVPAPGADFTPSFGGRVPDALVPLQDFGNLDGTANGLPRLGGGGISVGADGLSLDDGTLYPVISGAGGGVRAFLAPKGVPNIRPIPTPNVSASVAEGINIVPEIGVGSFRPGSGRNQQPGNFFDPNFFAPVSGNPLAPRRGDFVPNRFPKAGTDVLFDGKQASKDAAAAFQLEFAQVGAGVAESIIAAMQSGKVENVFGALLSGAGSLASLIPGGELIGVGLSFLGSIIPGLFGGDNKEEEAAAQEAERSRLAPPSLRLDFTTVQNWTFNGPNPDDARAVNAVTLNDNIREIQRAISSVFPRIERLEAASGVESPRGAV